MYKKGVWLAFKYIRSLDCYNEGGRFDSQIEHFIKRTNILSRWRCVNFEKVVYNTLLVHLANNIQRLLDVLNLLLHKEESSSLTDEFMIVFCFQSSFSSFYMKPLCLFKLYISVINVITKCSLLACLVEIKALIPWQMYFCLL